jgi:hypothetical protein
MSLTLWVIIPMVCFPRGEFRSNNKLGKDPIYGGNVATYALGE